MRSTHRGEYIASAYKYPHTPKGKVSAASPVSHSAVRSNGSTARVRVGLGLTRRSFPCRLRARRQDESCAPIRSLLVFGPALRGARPAREESRPYGDREGSMKKLGLETSSDSTLRRFSRVARSA